MNNKRITINCRNVSVILVVLMLSLVADNKVESFSVYHHKQHHHSYETRKTGNSGIMNRVNDDYGFEESIKTLVTIMFPVIMMTMAAKPLACFAVDDNNNISIIRIKECATIINNNCVSTASVKQVNSYLPPWTFSVTPDEVAARIKGVVATDPSLELVQDTNNRYFVITANRGAVGAKDQLDLLINEQDSVVTFRSADMNENPSISDFGANRKRLEAFRKTAGVFGVMGEGLTADSFEGRGEINGPMAQLKAFYGLQSGEGFQDVFDDE